MVYKLCYVDDNKAWFTSNWEKQWGDDWDDRPYEHNAEQPYTSYWENNKEYPIPQKTLYFELPYNCDIKHPNYGSYNSPFSVEDINNKVCPWLSIENNGNMEYIFAKTTYTNFIKTIKRLGGVVYLPK